MSDQTCPGCAGTGEHVDHYARTPPASEPVPEVAGLVAKLTAFANGCRGSMWQSRDETIRLMDQAAALLSAQAVMLEEAREALIAIRNEGGQMESRIAREALARMEAQSPPEADR